MRNLADSLETMENAIFEVSGDSYSYIGKVFEDENNGVILYSRMPARKNKGKKTGNTKTT